MIKSNYNCQPEGKLDLTYLECRYKKGKAKADDFLEKRHTFHLSASKSHADLHAIFMEWLTLKKTPHLGRDRLLMFSECVSDSYTSFRIFSFGASEPMTVNKSSL